MSRSEPSKTQLTARLRALLPVDWRGKAGERFRRAIAAISRFSRKHDLLPGQMADEAVVLSRRKLHGVANKELAAAVKDFAETEQLKIEAELKRRTMESNVRLAEAQARKEDAEARLAAVKLLEAELELHVKLQQYGVTLTMDDEGRLRALPLPVGHDLNEVSREQNTALTSYSTGEGDPAE
jgi:hypothetical protein